MWIKLVAFELRVVNVVELPAIWERARDVLPTKCITLKISIQ